MFVPMSERGYDEGRLEGERDRWGAGDEGWPGDWSVLDDVVARFGGRACLVRWVEGRAVEVSGPVR